MRLLTKRCKITNKTASYTATKFDDVLTMDATGGAITLSLPPAASCAGKILYISKADSSTNPVTIDPDGAETIDGFTTISFYFGRESIAIASNGANWHSVGGHYQSLYNGAPTISNAGISPSGELRAIRVGRVVTLWASLATGASGTPTANPFFDNVLSSPFVPISEIESVCQTVPSTETQFSIVVTSSGDVFMYRYAHVNAADQVQTAAWANGDSRVFCISYPVS